MYSIWFCELCLSGNHRLYIYAVHVFQRCLKNKFHIEAFLTLLKGFSSIDSQWIIFCLSAMHRTFQRDLYLLRLNTLREYAKSLDNSMNPISSDPSEPLKLNAQVCKLVMVCFRYSYQYLIFHLKKLMMDYIGYNYLKFFCTFIWHINNA